MSRSGAMTTTANRKAAPRALILGGLPGSGKSMWMPKLAPPGATVLDPRRIRDELPRDGYARPGVAACRLYLDALDGCVRARADVALETRMTWRGLPRAVERLVESGYTVQVVCLALASPALAARRVVLRVPHRPPEEDAASVERAFARASCGIAAFPRGLPHAFALIDNSGVRPRVLEERASPGVAGILPVPFLLQNLRLAVGEALEYRASRGWTAAFAADDGTVRETPAGAVE